MLYNNKSIVGLVSCHGALSHGQNTGLYMPLLIPKIP